MKGVRRMTNKRFTLNSVLNFDFGICDYDEPIGSLRNICELLNELHEENKRLQEENKELEQFRYSVFKKMEELI